MPYGHCLRHPFGLVLCLGVCGRGVLQSPHIPLKLLRSYLCDFIF